MSEEVRRYEVIALGVGCSHCGIGTYWTITDGECEIGTAWQDEELAIDICDLMNMAYELGAEEVVAQQDPIE
jgi:hypothetical protein